MRRFLLGLLTLAVLMGAPDARANVASWGYNAHGELCAGYISAPETAVRAFSPAGGRVFADEGNLFFLTAEHVLYACGANGLAGEGVGVTGQGSVRPVPVLLPPGVTAFAGHGWQQIALTGDGRVWTWGSNTTGAIGNGLTTHGAECCGFRYPTPAPVAGIETATGVFAGGGGDDFAILADGTVLGWGGSFGGQLETTGEVLRPKPLVGLSGRSVVEVAASGFIRRGGDVYARTASGVVLAQGRSERGQLGRTSPGVVPLPAPAAAVAVGQYSAFAVLTDGRLFAWGDDRGGQLGVPARETCREGTVTLPCARTPVLVPLPAPVVSVDAGEGFTAAVLTDGRVLVWGASSHGGVDGTGAGPAARLVPGVTGARVVCGRFHCSVEGEGPVRPVEATSTTAGSVTLAWVGGTTPGYRFAVAVRERVRGAKYGPYSYLPGTARVFTATGLKPGTEYELVLQGHGWGRRGVIESTGLSAVRHG